MSTLKVSLSGTAARSYDNRTEAVVFSGDPLVLELHCQAPWNVDESITCNMMSDGFVVGVYSGTGNIQIPAEDLTSGQYELFFNQKGSTASGYTATITKVLGSLSDDDIALTLDRNKRIMNTELHMLGVQGDTNSEVLDFRFPRYADGIDLSTKIITIHYITDRGYASVSNAVNVTTDDEYVYFSWIISDEVTYDVGEVHFAVHCIELDDQGITTYRWATQPAMLPVKATVNSRRGVYEQNPEALDQWLDIMNKASSAQEGYVLSIGPDGKLQWTKPIGNIGGSKDAVLYTPQELTAEQQGQARANMSVYAMPAVDRKLDKVYGKNLFNIATMTGGVYLNPQGETFENQRLAVSDFIPVEENTEYCVSHLATGGYTLFYDENHLVLPGGLKGNEIDAQKGRFTTPPRTAYIRISLTKVAASQTQVEKGSKRTIYVPYTDNYPFWAERNNVRQAVSSIGGNAGIARFAQFAPYVGGELTDYPYYNKNNIQISAHLEFDGSPSGTAALLGRGKFAYRGLWVQVTNSQVLLKFDTDKKTLDTQNHKLKIKDFLNIVFTVENGTTCYCILSTNGGTQKISLNIGEAAHEANGTTFVQAGVIECRNIILTATSCDFRKPMWAIGDSYYGYSADRVMGQLERLGFGSKMLVEGLAGLSSSGAKPTLDMALRYGTPKILIWALGMNDGDNDYIKYLNIVSEWCEERGTTLILQTVPSVPEKNKETINAAIRASGHRYIDAAKAVGAQPDGTWYPGYIGSDNVHPSEIGAAAIAMQYLVDAPEIMQY